MRDRLAALERVDGRTRYARRSHVVGLKACGAPDGHEAFVRSGVASPGAPEIGGAGMPQRAVEAAR